MDIGLAIRLSLLIFTAILVAYVARIAVRNLIASKKNVQVKEDSRVLLERMKKMLPLAVIALIILVALNVIPIFFR